VAAHHFNEVVTGTGFLTDSEIKAAIEAGFLIVGGSSSSDRIRHASYELRLGEAHVAPVAPAKGEEFEFTIRRLADKTPLRLFPGEIALLYSLEVVGLPPNVLGFTVARGLLFAEGLTPENTYVDPGFTNKLYTTVVNRSNRIITLQFGMPIARLFFFKLSKAVERPYTPGHMREIGQQVASEISWAVSTADEAKRKSSEELTGAVRVLTMAGNQVIELLEREQQERKRQIQQTRLWLIAVAAYVVVSPLVATVINASPRELSRPLLNLAERDSRASYPQFTARRRVPT